LPPALVKGRGTPVSAWRLSALLSQPQRLQTELKPHWEGS